MVSLDLYWLIQSCRASIHEQGTCTWYSKLVAGHEERGLGPLTFDRVEHKLPEVQTFK